MTRGRNSQNRYLTFKAQCESQYALKKREWDEETIFIDQVALQNRVIMHLGHAQYILWSTSPPISSNCPRQEQKWDFQRFFFFSSDIVPKHFYDGVGREKKLKSLFFFYRPFFDWVGRSAMLKINWPWPNSDRNTDLKKPVVQAQGVPFKDLGR